MYTVEEDTEFISNNRLRVDLNIMSCSNINNESQGNTDTPVIVLNNSQSFPQLKLPEAESRHDSLTTAVCISRRPSAIIAALRRPSQSLALSAAHAVMNQRRYFMSLFDELNDSPIDPELEKLKQEEKERRKNRKLGDDSMAIILSALYGKILVVLGVAFPISEVISSEFQTIYYQGYYLYLYSASLLFVAYMYGTLLRERAVFSIINTYNKNDKGDYSPGKRSNSNIGNHTAVRYGSFYLRLGAIAFGIGSMVYSGLEFGRYFDIRNDILCDTNMLEAITPLTRMILTLVQVQFVFLNHKDLEMNRHKIVARFGLMHMIATNLCEWLHVLVEETKHEIMHLGEHHKLNITDNELSHTTSCQENHIMESVVKNASPFLFPCTIEYSLICAVILFEMWKKVKTSKERKESKTKMQTPTPAAPDKNTTQFNFNTVGGGNSNHHFTVDCSNAHRGLFAGILVIVLTIISLIMFFVLNDKPNIPHNLALFEVSFVELILYIITLVIVIAAMIQMRVLKYVRDNKGERKGLGLDNTLLVVAQTGPYIYCMFSMIGSSFSSSKGNSPTEFLAEFFCLLQTTCQTMFILDGWWRRCRNIEQTKNKPGKELITFLIIANMSLWAVNSLEKNQAQFSPQHLEFFGVWAWTIITHVSMPLAIFYRFHSTICLFEIWKSAYKIKGQSKHVLFPYF